MIHQFSWQHNAYHRRGVGYDNKQVQNKFANAFRPSSPPY
jgi:hypothetical protein